MAVEMLEALTLTLWHEHLRVQRESFAVKAQPAGKHRPASRAPSTETRDGRLALWRKCRATLDRGCADQNEQLGLGRFVVDHALARQVTSKLEMARHEPLQRARELFDIGVLERRHSRKSWRERGRRAAVRPVDHQRVEVQIEIERTSESLRKADRATARAGVTPLACLAPEKTLHGLFRGGSEHRREARPRRSHQTRRARSRFVRRAAPSRTGASW